MLQRRLLSVLPAQQISVPILAKHLFLQINLYISALANFFQVGLLAFQGKFFHPRTRAALGFLPLKVVKLVPG